MLIYLDNLLLAVTQKWCDAVQRIFGWTKFRLEKWLYIIAMILLTIGSIVGSGFNFVTIMTTCLNVMMSISVSRESERQESEFLRDGGIFHRLSHERSARLLFLITMGALGVSTFWLEMPPQWFNAASCFLAIVWLYVSACVPRPPGKSKMREWAEKALSWLNDRLLAPAPAPIRA